MRWAVSVAAALLVAAVAGACRDGREPAQPPPSQAPGRADSPERLRLQTVASGLEPLVGVVAARDGSERLYAIEQSGRVRVVDRAGGIRPEALLDLRGQVSSGSEQGLLSIALHPARPRLFASYTDRRGDSRVVEYALAGERAARRRDLLHVDQPYQNHNGGQLAFGPDGLLYLGLGDGGSAFDPQARSQDLGSRLGKLLRVDVEAPRPAWRMAAYGLRNPWRFSFDATTGDLYIADVGQDRWEEINFVAAGRRERLNFGWDVLEGPDVLEDKDFTGEAPVVGPLAVYGHDQGCSVTGGFVYRGRAIPGLRGRFVYGDFCSGRIWSLRVRGGRAVEHRRERLDLPQLTSFGEDSGRELLAVTAGGVVHRVVPG